MTHSVATKLIATVIAYVHPIPIKETCILTDTCPRHGDACPTGRAHCKSCGTKLDKGYCTNELCQKHYEARQTTRM